MIPLVVTQSARNPLLAIKHSIVVAVGINLVAVVAKLIFAVKSIANFAKVHLETRC
jgi:hypothetical protein